MADVKLNITVNKPKVSTFKVGGKTLAEAKKALDARDEWGLYDATRNFKSSAQVDPKGNVVSVTMVLNPVIELPAWSGYGTATKDQKASWDAMCKALQAHENRHHDIQLECVEDLKKALKAAKTLDAKTLNLVIEKLQESAQKKQDAYDGKSGHGAKEGVILKLDA
jgi:predicted secreted Zn-dependent protease